MQEYTVQQGDTLSSISKEFYGTPMKYKEIQEANKISNPNDITLGMKLSIPIPQSFSPTSTIPQLDTKQIEHIMPYARSGNIVTYTPILNQVFEESSINTPLRVAHFLAQIAEESASLNAVIENFNYSATALMAVFRKYFPTHELADEYARKPELIANRVYANRMGNGDEQSGDGWKYIGRGLIQITGKENYKACGSNLELDLITEPKELEIPQNAVDSAVWFWNSYNLNCLADADDLVSITKKINGGTKGLEDRKKFLTRAKEMLLN